MWGVWLSATSDPPKALILGCSGTAVTEAERRFFESRNPLGFILFTRNVETPEQVRALVRQLRETVGRENAPILIDQEGGRVQRLGPPHWPKSPPVADIGALAAIDMGCACAAARLNATLLALDLLNLGINVDCAPVLDVPVSGAHDIIGDRAYSRDPDVVAALGRAACDGFLQAGVTPIVKHIPGHGRARADSHEDLPTVETSLAELERTDFVPFRALGDVPWAMTAHIVYKAIDPDAPATLSAKVVGEVIRGTIGFKGVLLTDDLSMKALKGDFAARARGALAAGCDVVLHCNGDMGEMEQVAGATAFLTDKALERLAA